MLGGPPVPWGRRQWAGINFCHPEVVKLQQQCHMQNTIFNLPQACLVLFTFIWRESVNTLETSTEEL